MERSSRWSGECPNIRASCAALFGLPQICSFCGKGMWILERHTDQANYVRGDSCVRSKTLPDRVASDME